MNNQPITNNRGDAIVLAKNILASFPGSSVKSYKKNTLSLLEEGFQRLNLPKVSGRDEVQKIYNEAFKPYWILLAFANSKKFAVEVSDMEALNKLLHDTTMPDLKFYVWYPTDTEVKRLINKLSQSKTTFKKRVTAVA